MKTVHVITRDGKPVAARPTKAEADRYAFARFRQEAIDGADTAAMSPPIWAVVEVPFGAGKTKTGAEE